MVATTPVTAEELLAMGSADQAFELIRGELVPVSPTSDESNFVAYYFGLVLGSYVKPRRLGLVSSSGGGWLLRRNPDTVVAPDVGFIRADRVPTGRNPNGFFEAVPDLAVEVVSPSDTPTDVLRKVAVYSEAGVPLVWEIYPRRRAVAVYRLGEPPVTLRAGDVLSGEDIVPGFEIPVEAIFADPLA